MKGDNGQNVKKDGNDGIENLIIDYPPNTSPLKHQVAGHFHGKGKTKLGMLKHINGPVLKPFQTSQRGENENRFYSAIFDEKCDNPLMIKLRQFIPLYLGVENITINGEVVGFIRLEDITSKFKYPCVLDIKIGKETYAPNAPLEKKLSEKSKYPLVDKIGIRILGMKILNPDNQSYMFYDKEFGKQLTEIKIVDCLNMFLQAHNYPSKSTKTLIKKFIEQLSQIKNWFLVQNLYHFYASSLLFVYDAYTIENCNCDCIVKMIDFTHVSYVNDNCIDENYLFGLNYIINAFNILLK